MVGHKSGKSKRRSPKKRSTVLRVIQNDAVHGFLEMLLTLGILYFAFSGAMTLALRTDSFWMAVVSQSMKHDGDAWRQYYTGNDMNPSKFPIQGGFERGDLLIIQGVCSFSEISVGDVVAMDQGPDVIPLVHRVVSIWDENGAAHFFTKGDANSYPLPIEKSNVPEQIIGKVIFVIPKIGYISLWFQGQ